VGAQIAVDRQIVQMGSFLAEAISSRQLLDMSEAVRGSLRASLIGMEGAGFEAIVDRLARTSIGDPAGLWLLDALVDMDPANYAGSMVRMYRAFSPKEQSQLVGWLCKMGEQSCDVLLTLVGGTLRRYPVDRRIAEAIQRRIGVDDLEKVAIKWWTRKHVPGADLILRILYNYPPETLMR